MSSIRGLVRCARILAIVALAVPGMPSSSPAAGEPLDVRLAGDYDRTPIKQVLKVLFLQSRLAYRIAGDSADFEARRLSLCVMDVRLRVILDALCDSAGCTWQERDGEVVFTPLKREGPEGEIERDPSALQRHLDDTTFTWAFGPVPVGIMVKLFEQAIGAEIELPADLADRKLDVPLNKESVRNGLDRLCELADCTWRVGEGKKGLSILIEGVNPSPP